MPIDRKAPEKRKMSQVLMVKRENARHRLK